MKKILKAEGVYKRYGKKEVLHDVSLEIHQGVIYGLLGRNGAGKTTLLSILTGQNTHQQGTVTYGGEQVWENERVLSELCFSRELSPMLLMGENTFKVKDYLNMGKVFYSEWDQTYADQLVETFGIDRKKKISKLSKGMMSSVTIILALASRAPVTILDEPVAGLDVVMRERFYKLLVEDYTQTNRTFIISTHIIEEAANVLEQVILMDQGRVLEVAPTEEFVHSFSMVCGHEDDIQRLCGELNAAPVHMESLGRRKNAVLRVDMAQVQTAADKLACRVDIDPVDLQRAFLSMVESDGGAAV